MVRGGQKRRGEGKENMRKREKQFVEFMSSWFEWGVTAVLKGRGRGSKVVTARGSVGEFGVETARAVSRVWGGDRVSSGVEFGVGTA